MRADMRDERDEVGQKVLFVGDLSFFTDEGDLLKFFSPFGVVLSIELKKGLDGHSLCHGFVEFQQHSAALEVLHSLQGFKLNGRRMRLNWGNSATTSPIPDRDSSTWTQLHVSFSTRVMMKVIGEEMLDLLFAQFGEVADVVVKRHNASDRGYHRQRGYCFVSFYDRDAALLALQSMKSTVIENIRFDCSLSKHSNSNSLSSHSFNDSKTASVDSNDGTVVEAISTVRGPSELVPGWNDPVVVGQPPVPVNRQQPRQQQLLHQVLLTQAQQMLANPQPVYYSPVVQQQSQQSPTTMYPLPAQLPMMQQPQYVMPPPLPILHAPVPMMNYTQPIVQHQPVYQQQQQQFMGQRTDWYHSNNNSPSLIATNSEQHYYFNQSHSQFLPYQYQQQFTQPQQIQQPQMVSSSWPPYSCQIAPTLPGNFQLPPAQQQYQQQLVGNHGNIHQQQHFVGPLSPPQQQQEQQQQQSQQHHLQHQQRSWPTRRNHSNG